MKVSQIEKMLFIVLGPIFMAGAVNLIFEPSHMVTGGVSGLAIIINEVTKPYVEGGVSVGIINLMFNIALFAIGLRCLGKHHIQNMIISASIFGIALFLIPMPSHTYDDLFLSSIFGGILNGLGLGLVFMSGSSTGGTELIGAIIHKYVRAISITNILMVIEAVIVLIGYYVFGATATFYSIVAIIITMKIADGVMSGFNYSKMVYVISEVGEEISKEIIVSLKRGVTGMEAKGMYTGQERTMLLCIIRPSQLFKLMEIVNKIDDKAFVIIADAREVMGEGFMENTQ